MVPSCRQELSPAANDGPCSQNEGKLSAFGRPAVDLFGRKTVSTPPVALRFEDCQRTEASGLANLVGKRQDWVHTRSKCLEEKKLAHRDLRKTRLRRVLESPLIPSRMLEREADACLNGDKTAILTVPFVTMPNPCLRAGPTSYHSDIGVRICQVPFT